jgi:hypothetical protein
MQLFNITQKIIDSVQDYEIHDQCLILKNSHYNDDVI